jgi:hypothetical protein
VVVFSVLAGFFSFLFLFSLGRFSIVYSPSCMHSISHCSISAFYADEHKKAGTELIMSL